MSTQKKISSNNQLHIEPSTENRSAQKYPDATATLHLSQREKLARRRKRLRQKQVKRQKFFLLFSLFSLMLIGAAVLLSLRQIRPEYYSINETCNSYRPKVEEVAARYGMSDYADLILALMMQESSGRGPDVLQASEGAYNKKYPQVPNGIQDIDYSIECGIQELQYSMKKAGVKNPTDMKNIQLALQGYNFGADPFFSYIEKKGISSWSEKIAEDFAKIASGNTPRSEDNPLYATAGPWDYGDQRYPLHVLRYYHP